MKHETLVEAGKAMPPVGVGGLTLFGIALNEWVLVGTLLYTLFLLIDKFPIVVQRLTALVEWVKARRK